MPEPWNSQTHKGPQKTKKGPFSGPSTTAPHFDHSLPRHPATKAHRLDMCYPPPPWRSVPHQDSATGTFPSPPPCFQTNLSWASPPLHTPSYPHTDKCTNHLQPMPAWAPSGPTQLPVGVSLCQSPKPHLDTPLGDHTKTTSSKKPGLTPPTSNHLYSSENTSRFPPDGVYLVQCANNYQINRLRSAADPAFCSDMLY